MVRRNVVSTLLMAALLTMLLFVSACTPQPGLVTPTPDASTTDTTTDVTSTPETGSGTSADVTSTPEVGGTGEITGTEEITDTDTVTGTGG